MMNRKQFSAVVVLALVAGLVGGVVSSWFLVGLPAFAQKAPQVAEVIRAERFEVVDKDGKTRAALSMLEGKPGLVLRDRNGRAGAELGLTDHGWPRLFLTDKNRKVRVGLTLGNTGEPHLVLRDRNGKTRTELSLRDTGASVLELADKNGKLRAALSLRDTGAPRLLLNDKNGKPIWKAP